MNNKTLLWSWLNEDGGRCASMAQRTIDVYADVIKNGRIYCDENGVARWKENSEPVRLDIVEAISYINPEGFNLKNTLIAGWDACVENMRRISRFYRKRFTNENDFWEWCLLTFYYYQEEDTIAKVVDIVNGELIKEIVYQHS